jgi:hypothetical protein
VDERDRVERIGEIRSTAWSCSTWLALQVLSPDWMRSRAHFCPPVADAGLASCTRSSAHEKANPVLRMPPGYSVVAVWSITESGVIAARLGGRVSAVKSWLMPP